MILKILLSRPSKFSGWKPVLRTGMQKMHHFEGAYILELVTRFLFEIDVLRVMTP